MTVRGEAASPQIAASSWRAWLAWTPAALMFGYAFMQRVAPSVMVADLMRDFGVGAAIVGQLSAFYFYSYAALQIPVGMMMDRIGPRRLMTGAALVAACGSFLFAASGGPVAASLGRALVGVGVGFGWVGTCVLAAAWFPPRRFGFLVGAGQLIGMLGGVFGQAPLAAAVDAWGWRVTTGALGAAGGVLGLAVWTLTRDRPAGGGEPRPSRPAGAPSGIRRVIADPQSWIGAWLGLALSAPLLGFMALWAVPFIGARYGVDRATAALVASAGLLGWGAGAPAIGWASDRIGRRRPALFVGTAASTLLMLAIVYLPGLPLFAAGAVLAALGFFGASMIMTFASAREHNLPSASGAAIGFVNTAVVASGAVMQPLLGWLLDLGWTGETVAGARVYPLAAYETALLVLPAVTALAFVACFFYRETWCRQSGEGAPS
jgi:MFS family permease